MGYLCCKMNNSPTAFHLIRQHVAMTMNTLVNTSNFRQYGQMEKQRWEESEKRRAEERRSEKRKSEKKEVCKKGSKVTKHCVFPIICGSGGSKSRLAKAAGAGAIWPDER